MYSHKRSVYLKNELKKVIHMNKSNTDNSEIEKTNRIINFDYLKTADPILLNLYMRIHGKCNNTHSL